MRAPSRTFLAVLLLAAPLVSAQPAFFGEAVPLTAERYGKAVGVQPLLLSNGREPVLFWSDGRVRATRYVNGQFPVSHVILQADGIDSFYDAVWTGTHFLVVAAAHFGTTDTILGRIVDRDGEPIGEPFVVADGRHPRIAFNGRNILLLYVPNGTIAVYALLLTPEGKAAEAEPRPLGLTTTGRVNLASNGDTFAAVVPLNGQPRFLMFNARGEVIANSIMGDNAPSAAIASDGRRYLVVSGCGFNGACGPIYTRLIEADGSFGPPLELDEPLRWNPSAVWTGSQWVIAYMRDATVSEPPQLQLVHVDAKAERIEQREQRAAGEASLAFINGNLLAAWIAGEHRYGVIHVSGLPLATSAPIPASFSAVQQTIAATASSNDGVLVVWSERTADRVTIHTGVRRRDGRWSERQIDSLADTSCCGIPLVLAASDGQEFRVIAWGSMGRAEWRLDENGAPIGPPIAMHNVGTQLLWNGREYVMLPISPPHGVVGQSAVYASDGKGGMYAVWQEIVYENHYPQPSRLKGIRLTSDFRPAEAEPRLYANDERIYYPDVEWNGSDYVVAWSSRGKVMAAHASDPAVYTIAEGAAYPVEVTAVAGGAGILWRVNNDAHRVVFLRHDGTFTAPITLAEGSGDSKLASLPDGKMAFLHAGYPHGRITMRIGSVTPLPALPDAPAIDGDLRQGVMHLSWTAPAQPVTHYRVEVRVDGGAWTEIAMTTEHALTYAIRAGSKHAFRVRAVNDAGAGAYSSSVFVNGVRRRAVR